MRNNELKKLVMGEDLTLRSARDVQDELLRALEEHERIEIDCAGASEVDLSFLQILIAARKSAERTGKTILLHYTPDGALDRAVHRAGLAHLLASQAA